MPELSKDQQNKLIKVASFLENVDLGYFEKLEEIAEHLRKIAEKEMAMEMPDTHKVEVLGAEIITIKGEPGDSPTDEELTELITPLIPKPIKGDDYVLTEKDKKEIASKITVPIVEKVIEKTEIIKELIVEQLEIVEDKALGSKKEEVLQKYPFTDEAREILSKIPVIQKSYTALGGEFLEKTTRGQIVVSDKKSSTLFHEMLHAYIYNSGFFSGIKYAFQEAFNKEVETNHNLQLINSSIEGDPKNYPDKSTFTEERFCYVAEVYGAGGIQNFPSSLQPYYVHILTNPLPTQIRDYLESLKEDERLDKSAIKGLEDEILKLKKEIATKSSGGGVRRVYQPYVDDFSDDTDGSTKTFYLSREPLKTNTILVWGTDFPVILRPTTDFTVVGKTLTLTSAIQAPSQGATLLIQYYA